MKKTQYMSGPVAVEFEPEDHPEFTVTEPLRIKLSRERSVIEHNFGPEIVSDSLLLRDFIQKAVDFAFSKE